MVKVRRVTSQEAQIPKVRHEKVEEVDIGSLPLLDSRKVYDVWIDMAATQKSLGRKRIEIS